MKTSERIRAELLKKITDHPAYTPSIEVHQMSFDQLCRLADQLDFCVDVKGVGVSYLRVIGHDGKGAEVEILLPSDAMETLKEEVKKLYGHS